MWGAYKGGSVSDIEQFRGYGYVHMSLAPGTWEAWHYLGNELKTKFSKLYVGAFHAVSKIYCSCQEVRYHPFMIHAMPHDLIDL